MKKIILFVIMLAFAGTMAYSQTTPGPVSPDQMQQVAPGRQGEVKQDRKKNKKIKKAKMKARRDKKRERRSAPGE